MGFTSNVEFSLLSGRVLRATDANGLIKETVYNKFGMVVKEEVKREEVDGAREIALPYWCTALITPACPEQAMYFVAALDDQGDAPQSVYFDSYSREILKKTVGAEGKQVLIETQYDSQGRKVAVSEPYFAGDSIAYKRTFYDAQGKVLSTQNADGTSVSVDRTLLTVTTTNALNQSRTITNNLQGKPVISRDYDGNQVRYTYDVEGKLLTTTDPDGNVIENRYDILGRKIFMSDPDMGQWHYEYDAFGNMLSQTDSKGQVITMQYDVLNRLVKRIEPEGITTWTFDTAQLGDSGMSAKGALQKVSGPNGYQRIHFYDQFGRAVKELTTIKGQVYETQRSYHKASEKVNWRKYPSGLGINLEYDDYGNPKRLISRDVDLHTEYQRLYDEYKDKHFEATEANEAVKDELAYHKKSYDDFSRQIKPQQKAIENLYKHGESVQKEVSRLGSLVTTQSNRAHQYYREYTSIHSQYVSWTNRGNSKAHESAELGRRARYNANRSEEYVRSIKRAQIRIAKILGGVCHNNYDVALRGASCQDKKPDEQTAKTAQRWVKEWSGQIAADTRRVQSYASNARRYYADADRRSREANDAFSRARSYYNSAKAKERLITQHNTHAQNYRNQQQSQITHYENLVGKWESRSVAGNRCLVREGIASNSSYCLTKLGNVQQQEDVLKNSHAYRQIIYHREQYDTLIAPINSLNEEVVALETQVKNTEHELTDSINTYWEAGSFDASGRLLTSTLGNGVETSIGYDEVGRVIGMGAQKDNDVLQSMLFQYNAIGNLTSRKDSVTDLYEAFTYDNMNRLTNAQLTGQGSALYQSLGLSSQRFEYDALGNITYKSDVGHYSYGQGNSDQNNAGPHALTKTIGDINAIFTYDKNGNQIEGHGKVLTYASFNKPINILSPQSENRFEYGPERQMVYQYESTGNTTKETRYIGNQYEEVRVGLAVEAVHHITVFGQPIAVVKTAPDLSTVNDTHYLHQDHLDSIVMITDEQGEVVQRRHYDAFGKLRTLVQDISSETDELVALAGFMPFSITDRSYTGHKYLKAQELIHMKGRVYDPTFGRFVSADPHIQAPLNSQSFNRYAYVVNNPLSLTDPSGYFFGSFNPFKLAKKIVKNTLKIVNKVVKTVIKHVTASLKFIAEGGFARLAHNYLKKQSSFYAKYNKVIAAVAISIVAPGAVAALGGFIGGAAGSVLAVGTLTNAVAVGALAGYAATGTLKGAVIGGLTAGAFRGVGNAFSNANGSLARGGFLRVEHLAGRQVVTGVTTAGKALQTLAHGVVGGTMSVLSGGSFKTGFLSGGVTKLANVSGINSQNVGNSYTRTAIAALIGGGVSKLTGGKFENGAVTGAFSQFFNAEGGGKDFLKHIRKSITDTSRYISGIVKGSASIFSDTFYEFPRQTARAFGLMGSEEYYQSQEEGWAAYEGVKTYISDGGLNDFETEKGVFRNSIEYARNDKYYEGRLTGRSITGFVLAPLGVVANFAATMRSVESGGDLVRDILYGEE